MARERVGGVAGGGGRERAGRVGTRMANFMLSRKDLCYRHVNCLLKQ